MQYKKLGTSDISVSSLCLGTMTFGEQNSEQEAHAQLEYAVDHGINFIDTAEIYPVPPRAETQGRTEEYLGSWLRHSHNRERVIVATKVAGPSSFEWMKGHTYPRFSKLHIGKSLEASLERLQTSYIDLYQLHWPERHTNYFSQLRYQHIEQEMAISLEETLSALQLYIDKGMIRHIGVSNETAWGVHKYIGLHDKYGLPRIQSIQNPYSLLNRSCEVGLAEMAIREECGILAYSVLGFGVLTGKFFSDQDLSQTRIKRWPDHFRRYSNEHAKEATKKYVALARRHGLTPTQLAISFVEQAPWVTSCIIGARTMEQLKENIAASETPLSAELKKELDAIDDEHPFPAP